eukprot:CAMPEP_0174829410 /NCGR_PEP_ID=MMETSP1114-20130205/1915_1 /TAXON_ID=312471 /ORGANISM="Neobodo designis, Strain CCAP 1951/1" /LENGTH=53 /DNA_ID=CAMNT_0016063157 /DNA_START=35 /DNA_END=196 /DNA_ORIENTATION=+
MPPKAADVKPEGTKAPPLLRMAHPSSGRSGFAAGPPPVAPSATPATAPQPPQS